MHHQKVKLIGYYFLFVGVFALVLLHLLGVVPELDNGLLYFVLILVGMVLIPAYDKVSFAGLHLEKVEIKNADEDAVKDKESELETEIQKFSGSKYDAKEVKKEVLSQFLKKQHFSQNDVRENRQIKLLNNPIAELEPIFSWCIKHDNEEIFVEPKFTTINRTFYNKLYVMLEGIKEYKKQQGKNVKLFLLVAQQHKENKCGINEDEIEKIESIFNQSLNSGLLEIKRISLESKDEK